MAKHNSRNTVSVPKYCGKCKRETPHRNDGTRTGPCLSCIERLEEEHRNRRPAPEIQNGFDFSGGRTK